MMTAQELVRRCVDIARNYKTLYVMGCFGAPMTAANKARYIASKAADGYNNRADRKKMINAASADTFGFDCVNLIKGILWGWIGDKSKKYGGAVYVSNGVPDVSADGMIKLCKSVTTDFRGIVPGAAVWMSGHIGVYVGGGLAVECSPKWANGVQITAVGNIGKKSGYNTRTWTKWGLLPYVDYTKKEEDDMDQNKFNEMFRVAMTAYRKELATQPAGLPAQVAEAKAMGISDGYRPRDLVTREEVMAMSVAAAKK